MLKHIGFYKPNLDRVVTRYQKFYDAKGPGHICTFVDAPYQGGSLENMPLTEIEWENEGSYERYLDMTLRNLGRIWEAHREILDDNIPTAYVFIGIAEYSAFLGGEVAFQEDTSYASLAIHEWSDLDHLRLDEENFWLNVLEQGLRHLVSRCDPFEIPIVRGNYAPLDLAQALRGEALFTDFFENPEWVHKLMRFCTRATIWLEERLQKIIGEWRGGRVAGGWLPPRTICMSEDVACMVSPKTYSEFARPYTQQVIDAFGFGMIHTHSLGFHVIPEIAKLNNLLGLQIAQDPNTPQTFEKLDELLDGCGKVPLSVSCTLDDLKIRLPSLSERTNIILCPSVGSVDEAHEAVDLIRRYSVI
jgi:hypothetical protein